MVLTKDGNFYIIDTMLQYVLVYMYMRRYLNL